MLTDIIDAMQTIHRAVTGVVTAPPLAEYPDSLEPMQCPFVMTWVGGGSWDEAAMGLHKDETTFRVLVLIAPVALGIIGSLLSSSTQLLDAFRHLYLDYENIQTLGGTVEQCGTITHEGLQIITYAGVEWRGFMLTIPTILKEIKTP
ncbi:hypothetical protein [Herpetosiphon geysericola]|uniref:Uncharacterized protein n=1 Tax=Herpetosiphon geysericola TaxID=70996 RepID=A0A0P6XJA9_9CHLR|nr:hypothetical protein [Herpetosiphon geysericola]KPL80232.1 hypothetical protein SE18_24570 [Herpetosiphon geysericola]